MLVITWLNWDAQAGRWWFQPGKNNDFVAIVAHHPLNLSGFRHVLIQDGILGVDHIDLVRIYFCGSCERRWICPTMMMMMVAVVVVVVMVVVVVIMLMICPNHLWSWCPGSNHAGIPGRREVWAQLTLEILIGLAHPVGFGCRQRSGTIRFLPFLIYIWFWSPNPFRPYFHRVFMTPYFSTIFSETILRMTLPPCFHQQINTYKL